MTDSTDREASIDKAYKIIRNSPGIGPIYREKLLRSINKLHDPGGVAGELVKRIKDKGLKGDAAARYFFKSFMNAVNE